MRTISGMGRFISEVGMWFWRGEWRCF